MSDESVADIKFSKRFSANLIANIISLIISTLVGLLLVPYFIDTLGEAAYGLIPLATSVTTYVTLLVNSLNAATGRYLMFDLRAGKVDEAKTTFNTAIATIICCVLLLLPVALFLTIYSPVIFNIGGISSSVVIALFGMIFGSALLNIITANFTLALFSYNRFDLKNLVTILQTLIQVSLIILLFTLSAPSLVYIGGAYFTAAIFALVFAIFLSKKYCSELELDIKCISRDRFKTLLSMTVWTLIKYIGVLLRSNIGLIIANIICGIIVGAEYAIILMWQILLVSIVSSITMLFNPNVYVYCANNDENGLYKFVSLATRTTAIISALIIGLLAVYASELLTLWVGERFTHLGIFAILLVLPIMFGASSDNLNYVMIAKLKFKENALIYCAAGILTLVGSLIGAYLFGMIGIIVASGLVMILCESGGIFFYTAHLLGKKVSSMLSFLIPGIIMLFVTLGIGYLVKILFTGDTIFTLIIGGSIIALFSLLICTRFLLNKDDRKSIRACIPGGIEKIIPSWLF